jgi:predicted Rossmann fold nucleotide-binding protein DprA/Smf involved in DNA uptake
LRNTERGFLLLTSSLGDPNRKPLTTAQMRRLADRSWQFDTAQSQRELTVTDLLDLGYGRPMAQRILDLLSQEEELDHYLHKAARADCLPLTRVSAGYPLDLRRRLGLDSPGVLWAKGDPHLLESPRIALVGSRDLRPDNQAFAAEAGRQAALQGYCLVSGNARGADRTAQESCLRNGGQVISVIADELTHHTVHQNVLYLSEEDFDLPFSATRALSRNRCIHALAPKVLVCQATCGMGGTWDGTVKNLRFGWSNVFCFDDGSDAARQLIQMGATPITLSDLTDLSALQPTNRNLFDQ